MTTTIGPSTGWTNDLEVRLDFLPESLRHDLVADIDVSRQRMRRFILADPNTPTCVTEAAAFASRQLGHCFNCAILKIYRRDDAHTSGAYDAHHDPPTVRTAPLVLCTLTGQADLDFWSPAGAESRVRCVENMVALLNPTLRHRVSPPLGPDPERRLFYLFFDTAVENAGACPEPVPATTDLGVRFDFLPDALRQALIADIDESGQRIREFDLDQPDCALPACLAETIAHISKVLDLEFNSAILKVYRLTDARRSGAYDPHRDQPDGATVPIVVVSLHGQADLTIWSDAGGESSLRCVDNMVAMFKPTLLHSVSEPLGTDGARYLLTLYFDISPDHASRLTSRYGSGG